MKIPIDIHGHVWNNQMDQVDAVVAELDELQVGKLALMPIAPYMTNDDTAKVVEMAPDRLIGFASVLPFALTTNIARTDPTDELKRAVLELGLKGVKLHPLIQGFDPTNAAICAVMRCAADLGVPVLFHTGPSYGRNGRSEYGRIEKFDDLAMMCPETTIIVGHADPLGSDPFVARKHPNVYLEMSLTWYRRCSLIPGLAEQAIEIATPEKVLFGSDYSLGKPERVTEVVAVLENSTLSQSDLDLICEGNAKRILGLA